MREWLTECYLVLFLSDVIDRLDLSEMEDEYLHLKGDRQGFHPSMMVKLLVCAYCVGVPSSGRIEKKTFKDVAKRKTLAPKDIEAPRSPVP